MRVVALEPEKQVVWDYISGPWEQTGEFHFQITLDERGTALSFEHRDWPEADDFYAHCNTKWGFFLGISLKSYLETGEGRPSPMDPNI